MKHFVEPATPRPRHLLETCPRRSGRIDRDTAKTEESCRPAATSHARCASGLLKGSDSSPSDVSSRWGILSARSRAETGRFLEGRATCEHSRSQSTEPSTILKSIEIHARGHWFEYDSRVRRCRRNSPTDGNLRRRFAENAHNDYKTRERLRTRRPPSGSTGWSWKGLTMPLANDGRQRSEVELHANAKGRRNIQRLVQGRP